MADAPLVNAQAPVTVLPPSPLFTSGLTVPQQRAAWRTAQGNVGRTGRFGVTQRYAAPAYPFGATVGSVFGAKSDENVVVTSIVNILTTPKGSVPYDPRIGSVVPYLIFEILDEVTVALVRYYTYKDLTEQEPRIVVRDVSAQREGDHLIVVQVGFSLVGDPEGQVFGTPVVFAQSQGGI